MRISEFLRASFVGALLFTPAMADEVEQVHEEALRVLREQLGHANSVAPGVEQAAPESAELRAEREARMKADAQQRMVEQDRIQSERRQQFEQFVKERERLRQSQREYDVNAARQAGLIRESSYNDVHARALNALHEAQGLQQTPANPAPSALLAPASVESAPVLLAQTSSALSPSTQSDSADVHAKALEVLRQQQGGQGLATSTTVVGSTNELSKPSPELQQRLKEMQVELEQEQIQKRTGSSSIPQGYATDLERRAQESVQGSAAPVMTAPATTPPPAGFDPATRDMIERQNREIARGLGAPPPAAPKKPTVMATPASAPAPAPVTTPVYAPPQTSVVTHTTASEGEIVQYSKELEERARQILLERAGQNVQTAPGATMATTVTTTTSPLPDVTPAAPAPTPAFPPPEAVSAATAAANNISSPPIASTTPEAPVHSSAIQTLHQAQPVETTGPRTKMQRIKELTDLYRADKMGPAEYHQKRAQILAEP